MIAFTLKRACSSALISLVSLSSPSECQMRVVRLDEEQGPRRVGLAIRNIAKVEHLHAHHRHPDDERTTGCWLMLNRGQGYAPRWRRRRAARRSERDRTVAGDLRGAAECWDWRAGGAAPSPARKGLHRAVDFGIFSIEGRSRNGGKDRSPPTYVRGHLNRMIVR